MTDTKIKKAQEQIVSKHNDLIQNARFDLSAQEQKIIAYMISKIRPTDTGLEYKAFRLDDFLELTGASDSTRKGGSAKSYLKSTLKGLRDKSFWITRDDGKEILCSWLNKVVLDFSADIVLLRLDDELLPLLVGLSKRFMHYQLFYILEMTSGYSIRLYELLKSEAWKGKPALYKVDEIKRLLGVEGKYTGTNSANFYRKCIDIAVREINELTDLKVAFKKIKTGKAYTHLQFIFKEKQVKELGRVLQANEAKRGGQVYMETPTTNDEAFPIAELAENIEELVNEETPLKDTDCKTFAQLQAWQAKYKPHYNSMWLVYRAKELGVEGVDK